MVCAFEADSVAVLTVYGVDEIYYGLLVGVFEVSEFWGCLGWHGAIFWVQGMVLIMIVL